MWVLWTLMLGESEAAASSAVDTEHPCAPDLELNIEIVCGSLTVRGSDRKTVKITGSVDDPEALDVSALPGRVAIEVDGSGRRNVCANLVVDTPRHASITAETVSAPLTVTDVIGRLGLTIPEIANAISQQNQLSPAGQIGGPPAASGTEYTYTVRTQGRLLNEEEFGNILVRTTPQGEVRLRDVARLELGTMLYNAVGRHDGTPSAVMKTMPMNATAPSRARSAELASSTGMPRNCPAA